MSIPELNENHSTPQKIQISELKQIGPYMLLKTLGKGSYAVVKLGLHEETTEKVAVKIIRKISYTSPNTPKAAKQELLVRREVAILKMLHHPAVVQLLDFIETPQFYVLIMEYVPGKTLYDVLRKAIYSGQEPGKMGGNPLPIERIFRLFYQLVSALDYCHSLGIAHRDIKPENILVDETTDTLKLTDFGLAGLMQPDKLMETFCGSPHYAPPEILRGEKYKGSAADVWSLGVVLFVMVVGRLPFLDESLSVIVEMICDAAYQMPLDVDLHLQDLIERMLHPMFVARISLPQLKNHPWWLKHCLAFDLNPAGMKLVHPVSHPLTNLSTAEPPGLLLRRLPFSSHDDLDVTDIASPPPPLSPKQSRRDCSESLCVQSSDRSLGATSPRSLSSDGAVTISSTEGKSPKTFPRNRVTFASRMRSAIHALGEKLRGKASSAVHPVSP